MAQDREPLEDPEPAPGDASGTGEKAGPDGARGRHDILESSGAGGFWSEVDGMLTGEFTTDFLPKEGDYTLGAIPDAIDASSPGSSSGPLDTPDPALLDAGEPTGPVPAMPTAGPQSDIPLGRSATPRRGAHDIDPDQLGFNVVGDDETGFGAFIPNLDDGPFAPGSTGSTGSTAGGPGAKQIPASGAVDPAGGGDVPPVSTSSARLFDGVGDLPTVSASDGGRLFPPKADPTVAPGQSEWPPPSMPTEPVQPRVGHVPLFDPTNEVRLSTPASPTSPVSLERSTVVGSGSGAPPGSSFLEGETGVGSGAVGPVGAIAGTAGTAGGSPPTISLEAGRAGQAGSTTPGGPPTIATGAPTSVDPYTVARVATPPTGYQRRDILLDVVDRQWFTSALVAVAAISVGVVGWLLFLGDDDSGDGTDLVAASTTLTQPAESTASAAAASAGAGTGGTTDSATSTETTEVASPVTNRNQDAGNRPTRRPPSTPAPTTAPPPPPTSDSSTSSETTTSSSSSSSTDTTEPSTTSTEPSTTTTSDGTVTTAEDPSTTNPSSTSSSSSSSSTDTTTSSTTSSSDPPTSDDDPPAVP